ncbi:hypothetical protein UFOVP218_90 [uncultured Caudovirales phage]|uniref:Uncharacterized protein n=1 Tax=uncultured Caudovirales phage TaxID=2100421 RepID=A0A6J7WTZ6_9CAUD|nr:hypothetical protein UFOVP218_90 [uncultured Caudovirales phage]
MMKNKTAEATMGRPASPNGQSVTLQEFEEGYAEQIDPTTGRDISDVPANGIEMMTPVMPDRDQGTTHEGDMGRLGKY